MAARALSLNVGSSEPNPVSELPTGIHKIPVDSIEVRAPGPKHGGLGSGVVDDFLGSRQHHGGDSQAVYAVAREELDWWSSELGRDLPSGMFGENLTTQELDVDAALIGDQWRIGDEVVLQVTSPRIPCATFAGRMGERGWVRRFSARGRTGAYLSVVMPGTIRPGDAIEIASQADHDVTLPMVFRAFLGDLDLADRVLAANCLWPADQADLADRVARRRQSADRAALG